MVLIRKSASDIENEYKRIFIRFLKEINMLSLWYQYVGHPDYFRFANEYVRKHPDRTIAWWDRKMCADIMGMCNFYAFTLKKNPKPRDYYDYFLLFLAIFWEEEFYRWEEEWHNSSKRSAEKFISSFRSTYALELIERWVKLKKALG